MIASLVKNEVFKHFANGEFKEAERMLRKLNLKLTNKNTTEDYRLVIYNLAWVQDELGLHEEAKRNIQRIREIVETGKEFCKNNIENYTKLLGLHAYIYADELTIEESIEVNKRKYDLFCNDINYLPEALISKFNIYYIKNDIEGMVDCIESIHNYECQENLLGLTDKECIDIKIRLSKQKNDALALLKEKNIDAYNELYEEIKNLTDSSILI